MGLSLANPGPVADVITGIGITDVDVFCTCDGQIIDLKPEPIEPPLYIMYLGKKAVKLQSVINI